MTLLIGAIACVCVAGAFTNAFTSKEVLSRNLKLLAEFLEGDFSGFVWEHRLARILGFTVIGRVENEPAFSDESCAQSRAMRLIRHVLSLDPRQLVIDWRLCVLQETPEAFMVHFVKKLNSRRCRIALVIHKDADPACTSQLLKYVELKRSVPEAIEWLSQTERPKSGKPGNGFPRWATIVAGSIGILTFLFFVTLSVAGLFHHTLPPADRFPAVVVLAFGTSVSSVLISGKAFVKGRPVIPFAQKSTPVQFVVVGSIATLVVLLILGKILFG
jgi:hypothetical protein